MREMSKPRGTRNVIGMMVLVMSCTGVAQGFGRFSYAVVLPSMVRTLLHSYSLAGTLGLFNVGAYLVGTALLSFVGGRLSGTTLIKIGLAISASGMLLISFSSSFLLLGLGMAMAGLGGSFIWIPAPAIAAQIMPPNKRGLAMGLAGAGIGLSITAASLLARWLGGLGGQTAWRYQWRIEAGFAYFILILALLLLSERSTSAPLGSVRGRGRDLLAVSGWKLLVGVYSIYGFAYALFLTFLVATLERQSHFSAAHATTDYAVVGFVSIFGGVIAGRISDRVGRPTMMLYMYVLMALSCVLVLLGGEPLAVLGAIAFGIPQSGIPNAVAAYLGDRVPARSFAATFGVVTLCFGVFQALATQLGGTLATDFGTFAWDYVLAGVLCLAGVGLAFALRVTEGRAGQRRVSGAVVPGTG